MKSELLVIACMKDEIERIKEKEKKIQEEKDEEGQDSGSQSNVENTGNRRQF